MKTSDLLPPHSVESRSRLQRAIEETLVVLPLVKDSRSGEILDGRERARIAKSLGIRPEEISVGPFSAAERDRFRVLLNVPTREWSQDLMELVTRYIESNPTKPASEIAGDLGISPTTAAKYRKESAVADTPTIGKDGRVWAPKPKPKHIVVPVRSGAQRGRVAKGIEEAAARGTTGNLSPRKLVDTNNAARREELVQSVKGSVPPGFRCEQCDFRSLSLPDHSVDCIFTDPPWAETELARPFYQWTSRKLKKDGTLFVYTCDYHLLHWANEMRREFSGNIYIIVELYSAATRPRGEVIVNPKWAPILFTNRGKYKGSLLPSVIGAYGLPEAIHPKGWNRNVEPARFLVYKATQPGALICDPFSGCFTTALGVMEAGEGRRFVGCEKDKKTHAIGVARLKKAGCQLMTA